MCRSTKLYTANFRQALALKESPKKFIEFLVRLLGTSGRDLLLWAETIKTEEELKKTIDALLSDETIDDEWKFLSVVRKTYDIPEEESAHGEADGYEQPIPETAARLVGKKIQRLQSALVSVISSTVLADGSKFIVIRGGPARGKTLFLRAVCASLHARYGIRSAHYKEFTNPHLSLLLSDARVVTLDNMDREITGTASEMNFLRFFQSRSQVFLASSRDVSKMHTLLTACDGLVYTLPEPNDHEVGIILSRHAIKGLSLSTTSARTIVNLFTAFGVRDKTAHGIDVIRMLVAPELFTESRAGITRDAPEKRDFTRAEIERAVSVVTGMRIMPARSGNIERLSKNLEARIKGQRSVIQEIVPLLASVASGLSDPTKPPGVLLFYGPTGSGKTEMGKVIADIVCEGVFHKEDMNTYSEKHSVSKITGAPPGYVGYGELPALIEFIDSHRRGVLLFDEIEKAHESVMDHIMELMDTGMLRDTRGKLHNARGFLIIMTSNVTCEVRSGTILGFQKPEGARFLTGREELTEKNAFKPEFLGRITVISRFQSINDTDVRDIARIMLDDLMKRLRSVGIDAGHSRAYLDEVVSVYDTKTGARSMKNYIETHIKNKIVESHRTKQSV